MKSRISKIAARGQQTVSVGFRILRLEYDEGEDEFMAVVLDPISPQIQTLNFFHLVDGDTIEPSEQCHYVGSVDAGYETRYVFYEILARKS